MSPPNHFLERTIVPQSIFKTLHTKNRFDKRRGFSGSSLHVGFKHSIFYCFDY